ncbi:LOW QUALITY PROTEIN: hypothetical protein HID58_014301, partial [Brassica napus]
KIVTRSFAALVPLLPLARGVPPPVGLSKDLSSNAEDAKFLEQLLDNSHIDDYKLCTDYIEKVINAENASMKTMNTDQLLDLFASAETSKKGGASLKKGSEDNGQTAGTGKGIKSILGNLEELWDQSQYTEEYNLSHFLAKLNGQ